MSSKFDQREAAIAATAALSLLVNLSAIGGVQAQTPSPNPQSSSEAKPSKRPEPAASPASTEAHPAVNPSHANGKIPTQAVVVGLDTLEGVSGKPVRSETGEDMGRITDILVGANGEAKAAVIDFGGFLGVGSRKVAVDWKTLNFADSIKSGSVRVSLTRDQVRQSPEYKSNEPVVILEASRPTQAAAPPNATAIPSAH